MTIDFSPQTREWLASQARLRGVSPVDIAQSLIEDIATANAKSRTYKSVEDKVANMNAFARSNASLPSLPDSAFDRSSTYPDKV